MKLLIVFTSIVLLLACSTNLSIKNNSPTLSKLNDNYRTTTDSILVDIRYEALDTDTTTTYKFAGTSNENERFAIVNFPVKYTKLAISNQIEGVLILQIEVLTDGTVASVLVKQSLMPGPEGLDEAAIYSVKKWKFSLQYYQGKPVASWITFPMYFSLN